MPGTTWIYNTSLSKLVKFPGTNIGELNMTVAIPLRDIYLILTSKVVLGSFYITPIDFFLVYLVTFYDVVTFVWITVVSLEGGRGSTVIENE